ncbi:Sec-independent protein translocase subunit TatA [Streptomyces cacaoi]|uniref:Sec-independent protein translocase subunit TatA n=1 Tax=Streptomyces cacaoi TaxID=1898 RepID=UPI00332BBFC3
MLRNGLEPWHLIILGIVLVLLFGSKKLPDGARALGKSMRILKSEARAMRKDSAETPTVTPGAPQDRESPRPEGSNGGTTEPGVS